MAEKKFNLRCLLSLLDDPDERAIQPVMAELLAHEDELDPDIIAEYQEQDNPLLEKRIDQLISTVNRRQDRRDFLLRTEDPEEDFFELLIDLHMLWFDSDSREDVQQTVDKFLDSARKNTFSSLEDIADWMTASGLSAEQDTTLTPELYCIGNILSSGQGAASLLTAIACLLFPEDAGLQTGKVLNDFAIRDLNGSILIPARTWQIFPADELPVFTPWNTRKIVHLASANLFSAAVNSDSLRYVFTLAQAVTGLDDDCLLSALPYPYNGVEIESGTAQK